MITGVTDTGIRFALLVTLVIASSITMLDEVLAPRPDDTPGDMLGCLLAAGFDPDGASTEYYLIGARRTQAMEECLSGLPALAFAKGMIATLLLLVVAALVHWWLPRRRDRRHRTLPVETVDADRTLATELAALRELTGTGPRVRFRVDPTRTTAGAVVYGRTGRYTVCLHAGLLARRGTDPDGFRAVVLHELAHVRNRDVDFAYASTALWRVFVVLALLPYLFHHGKLFAQGVLGTSDSPFWPGAASLIGYDVLSGLLLVALVHLARADLLRRRELLADARAVSWGADTTGWDHADRVGTLPNSLRRVTTLLRTHPGWAERRRALAEPEGMSGVGALEMFLTGVTASLLVYGLTVIPALDTTLTAWFAAALVTPVLCVVLWRSVVRVSLTAGQRTESGIRSGLWLGCGLVVGTFVRSGDGINDWLVARPGYLLSLVFIALVPAVWSAQWARLTLAVSGRGRRGAAALLNGLVTLLLLGGGLHWWHSWGRFEAMGVSTYGGAYATLLKESFPGPWQDYSWELSAISSTASVVMNLNKSTLVGVTAPLLWILPLLLHMCTGGRGLRVRQTLLAGLAGGLLCWAGFAAASYALHADRPATLEQRFGTFQFVQSWWLHITLLAACVLTAATVAVASRRHWPLRALLAAQVVQLMGYAGLFVLYSADGCLDGLSVVAGRCHWLPEYGRINTELEIGVSLNSAVLFSACAAPLGVAAGRAVRGLLRRPRPTAPVPPPGTWGTRGTWTATLKRSAVLALALPAFLLIAFTRANEPTSASPESAQKAVELYDPPPPTARSAKIRQWQAQAWLQKGGLKQTEGISEAFSALTDAVDEAARQNPSGDGSLEPDGERFAGPCGALREQAGELREYFPVPDQKLQRSWSAAITRLDRGSQNCQDALATAAGNPPPSREYAESRRLYNQSLYAVATAVDSLTHVLESVTKTATANASGAE